MHWRGVGEPFARRLSCSNAWPLEDAFYSELVPDVNIFWNEGTRKLQRFTYMILLLETHSLAFKMPLVISYAILLT